MTYVLKSSIRVIGLIILNLSVLACRFDKEKQIVEWDNNLTIEQNIARNTISFQSNEDFSFLNEISKQRSAIILGESTHYDPSSSEIKIKMIDYLKNKGHYSLAMESTPFLTSYIFSNPEYKEITKEWKVEDFAPYLWLQQDACKPLFEMINNRKIKLWGIDVDLGIYDIVSAKAIIQRYARISDIAWEKLDDLYLRKFVRYGYSNIKPLSVGEQYELMCIIDSLSDHTQYLISKNIDSNDLYVLLQWIRVLNTSFSYVNRDIYPRKESDVALHFRNRDSQMAENILWIMDHFPKEKLIVWCANFHGAKDISKTQYPTDSLLYFTYQSMGEGLYNKLRDKLYSLAITTLYVNEDDTKKEWGLLEQEINKISNGSPFTYIDFEPLRFADGYRDKKFDCAVIKRKKGNWLHIFDGVYYINVYKYD